MQGIIARQSPYMTLAVLSTIAQGMLSQGTSSREQQQAKRFEQRQHSEQGVTGEQELQQKKQKRWHWDQ